MDLVCGALLPLNLHGGVCDLKVGGDALLHALPRTPRRKDRVRLIAFTPEVRDHTCKSWTLAPRTPLMASRNAARLMSDGVPSSSTPTASRSSIHVRGRIKRPMPAEISGSA